MAFENATPGDAEMSHNVAFDWFTFLHYTCRHFACSQLLFLCVFQSAHSLTSWPLQRTPLRSDWW